MILSLAACGSAEGTSSAASSAVGTTAENSSPEATVESTPAETYDLIAEQTEMDKIAASTEHFSFTKGEMVYFFAIVFKNYYSHLSYFGIDPSVSLKEQQYTEDRTWFDVFLEEAMNYAQNYLLFSEAAYERGLELTQDDLDYIASQKTQIKEAAAEYGWDEDTYLAQMFGTNIDWTILEQAMQKMLLADHGYAAVSNELESKVSEEDIEAAYAENTKKYDYIDYAVINMLDAEALSDADKDTIVSAFSSAKDAASFTQAVVNFVKMTVDEETIKKAGSAEAYAEELITKGTQKMQGYADYAFMKWAYSEDRSGDVWVEPEEENGARYAYLLTASPYKDMETYVDARHILFLKTSYDSAESARKEAEKIYQQWLDGAKTEDAFANLAEEYSEDTGSNTKGGLYEGIYRGEMVEQFEEWCFDESRKPGDTGIVDTTYGSHIMYFVSSDIGWHKSVQEDLISDLYAEAFSNLTLSYPITEDEEVLNSIAW